MSKIKNNFKIRRNTRNYRKVKTAKKGRTLIFTLIFALILGSIPFIQKNNSNVSAVENEAYCTSAACRTAKKAEDEAAEFLYGETGFVVEVHQRGDDEEEDENFVKVGNRDVSCVRAQEVAFVPAH